jgi:inosine/xanthosine triphosphatase
MNINIGSKNKIKVEALKEIILQYENLRNFSVISKEVSSDISDQPKSLDETITGAVNRAKKIFKDCRYSFGIESGLMQVSQAKSGYMDVCVCAIYDGKKVCLGFSSAWEVPASIVQLMINKGLNMSEAALEVGLTENSKIGSAEGLIGILSKGKLTRKEYTKEAIRTALVQLEQQTK